MEQMPSQTDGRAESQTLARRSQGILVAGDCSFGNVDLERWSMLCGLISKPFQDECVVPRVFWLGCENC